MDVIRRVCPQCNRRCSGTRPDCMYCGATLPPLPDEVITAQRKSVADAPPPPPSSATEPATLCCPRCAGTDMIRADLGGVRIQRCPDCSGLWLDGATFDFLIGRQAQLALAKDDTGKRGVRHRVQRGHTETTVTYINCPVCGQQMKRANYAKCSGIIFDQCLRDGVWLDDAELQEILAFIASGGHQLAALLKEEAEHRARLARLAQPRRGGSGYPLIFPHG